MDKAVELLHQRFLHGGAVSGSSQHCFDMIVTLVELLGSLFVPDRIVLYLGNSKLKTVPPLFVEKSIHLAKILAPDEELNPYHHGPNQKIVHGDDPEQNQHP